MNAMIAGLLAATVLMTSASTSLAGQPAVRHGSASHVGGGRAFAAPMHGGHGFGARPGRVAYGHGVRSRSWDGNRRVYYNGDSGYDYGDPSLAGPDVAAALFGAVALGILQAAANR